MPKSNRPFEFIVYEDRPPYPGSSCSVRVMKIPRGKSFDDVRDRLPASMGRMAVVRAYSAATARDHARQSRGVTCRREGLGRSRGRRRRK